MPIFVLVSLINLKNNSKFIILLMTRFAMKEWFAASLLVAVPLGVGAENVVVSPPSGENICLLSSLELNTITCLAGENVRANLSTAGNPLTIRDTVYVSGVGTHAPSTAIVKVNGATRFVANLGIDDGAESSADKNDHGIVDYVVRKHVGGDRTGEVVMQGTIDRRDAESVKLDLDVTGWDYITLDAQQGTHAWADHVDWANAYFECAGERPITVTAGQMYADESLIVRLPEEGREPGSEIIPLSSLDLSKVQNGWGTIKADKSIDGNDITLNDTVYASGVGAHATGQIVVKLNGAVTHFVARLGIDDEVKASVTGSNNNGVCDYRVSLRSESGETKVVDEGTVRCRQASTPLIDVDCRGWKYLIIDFPEGAGGNAYDHFDLANAYFEYLEQNSSKPVIVSPDEISSKLGCATTVYAVPGVRFMQRMKAVSENAVITVSDLPEGLTWNAKRNLIEGVINAEGEYRYTATVTNGEEVSEEVITLTVSSSLQQPVPFMGWLSWNVFEHEISDEKVRAVADAFERYGLADAGYRYLCLDDLWHASARESGTNKPLCDTNKFPNGLKDLADYVHGKGLKFGVYSDAAAHTCAGAFGSIGYEEIDAKQYAEWGFDLLKYDYCGAPADQQTAYKRYKAMGDALKNSGRDILFYMCEWGVREPWKWGAETGATTWRCTYDTRDCWIGRAGGIGILQSIEGMKDIWPYSGVNRYNDADMMCIGLHGKGKSSNALCQTGPGMTQTEYQTQFSLWCMWASPLTLSFDVRTISDEDLAIITNEELIAINQDRMGQQAEFIGETDGIQVYAKDLENGDVALAILNLNDNARDVTVDFSTIGALDPTVKYDVRDLWLKEYAGEATGSYSVGVDSHETKVYRLSKAGQVGITSALASADIRVAAVKGAVTVDCAGTEGLAKRILVSDLTGRVLTSGGGTGETFRLPLDAPRGVYVVNVVCAGRSQTKKVNL